MSLKKTSIGLSLLVSLAALVHACQPDEVQDKRTTATGQTGQQQSATKGDNATAGDKATGSTTPGTTTQTPPAGGTPTPAPAGANYTMTWDASTDAAVVSYKVFVLPPDRNPRLAGKTDVPIQVKNYPIAGLTKAGTKYSVVVTAADVKAALAAVVPAPTTYCFSIVAVNAVGNSSHSPVICP